MLTQRLLLICYVSPTVAQFVAEQLLQNLKALKEFAKTGAFAQFAVRIRRLLARMTGRLGKNADLVKIERLLQRAVREAAKNPAATKSGEVRSSFMDSLSGMANDALLPYDEEMRGYIERRGDFIVDNYDKLVEIVNLAFDNRNKKATCYFGKIPANILEQIKNKIGNLPSDQTLFKSGKEYSIAVTLDGIRHIADEKNLGKEDVLDFLSRLADTVLECDTANFDYYNEPHGQRAPGILLKKSFADGTFVSFSIVSQKKKSLLMQTLYMDKADYEKRKSAKTSPLQSSHGRTPKALNGQTSTTIIHDSFEKNNPQSKSSIPFGFSMGAPQTAPTRTSRFTRASVDEQAKQLMRDAGAKGDRAEFTRILENFYEYVAQGQELSWDSITDATSPVVDWLTEHHATRNAVDADAAENFYRKTKVY